MEGEKRSLNSELWHACAGPLVSLPTIGSQVVYFPQGHSEQVTALTKKEADAHIPNYSNLPSQLICQLHNVTLHAEAETDEVYCQMILQPVNAQEKSSYLLPDLGRQNKQCNEYFCKTLTASDTSTHGGFSIPRRAAEKVFPPLDFSQQPPAQELVARDLHDNEWHFRHIYRGQPRRHLLTTGWSVFVSAKRLQAGDSVLFIRDENGQLLLGIRRANRIQPSMPSSLLSSDSMHIGILAAAAHAYNTSSRFAIFYNPRASPSEFVVPISKYNKAVYTMQFSIGMRFRMQFETEDSSSRRYTGTITGIGDLDPVRWPNSYWRSLKVGWDESASGERQKRVSLWEIEPFTTPFLFCSPALTLRTKRPRTPGAEQAMINGDMEDLTSSVRKSSIWLGGQNMGRIQSMGISSMNPDEWAQMRRPDSVRAAAKPDHHFAMMSAGLQGNCNPEASQQVLFHQNQQRLLSQNVQAGTKLLPQTLPPVIVEQPQHNQQQLHIQEQRKCNSQQHTQPLHHKSLQLEQRIIDARRSFLQCSSNNAQSILEKPVDLSPLRAINSFEAVSPSSTLVKPQGLLSRQHANTLPFIDTTRPLGVPHSNPGLIKDGSGLVPGLAADHLQSAAWFSMETEPIRMHDHLNSNATTAQIEMSANGLPFCVTDSEHVVQTGLFGIISHPSPFNPQEPTHGREHFQSDPRSHLLFGVSIDSPLVGSNTDCVSSVTFPENKNDHRQLGGNEPPCVTVTCSGSEALFNSNSQVSSVLDETVTLESDSNWKQLQPTRTFTKVYKTGSVGRSLDVTCLKNYNELRAEIAHMFGLEGQIEDPRISCWQLVFIDNENDVLLVGDDPWDEFVNCVRCIKVMSPSEVLQMSQDGIELFHSIPAPRPISSNSANNIAQRDMNNTNPTGAPLRSDH